MLNPQDGYIALHNKNIFGNYKPDVLKPIIYHEFFHMVQGCYLAKARINFTAPIWFLEATATYYEWEKEVGGKMPDTINGNKALLYRGIFSPSTTILKTELSVSDRILVKPEIS